MNENNTSEHLERPPPPLVWTESFPRTNLWYAAKIKQSTGAQADEANISISSGQKHLHVFYPTQYKIKPTKRITVTFGLHLEQWKLC